LVEPLHAATELVPSHHALLTQIISAWTPPAGAAQVPLIQLCGAETTGKRAIAAAVCAALDLSLHVLAADLLPTTATDLEVLLRLWEREAALSVSA
jgi:hypothetical protein